jgi:hypothetical protein
LYESGWDADANAAVESWHVLADHDVTTYWSTTWAVDDALLAAMFDRAGLAVAAQYGDITGAPFDGAGDMQTIVLYRSR